MHCCPYCQRGYSRKSYFDRHISICQFICKSKREQKLEMEEMKDTPTMRDLYIVVMDLVTKNKQLEEKVQEMSKWINIKKQNINIVDWLIVTYRDPIDYAAWLKEVKITRADLNVFFQTDYVGGVVSALKHQLSLETDEEKRPLRAFNNKDNVFYIYYDKKWIQMDNEGYLKLMYAFDKQMLIEFGHWQDENKSKLYSDEFSITFNKYMKKIMAIREPLYSRIKKELYTYLRMAAP